MMEYTNITVIPTTVRLESSKLDKPLAEILKGATVGSSSPFKCYYKGSKVTLDVKEYDEEKELLTKHIVLRDLPVSYYLSGAISFCKDRRISIAFNEPRIPKKFIYLSSYEEWVVCYERVLYYSNQFRGTQPECIQTMRVKWFHSDHDLYSAMTRINLPLFLPTLFSPSPSPHRPFVSFSLRITLHFRLQRYCPSFLPNL